MTRPTLNAAGLAETVATIDAGISALRANNAALALALREMTGRMVQMCSRPDLTERADLPEEWRLINAARVALKAGGTP